MASALTIGRIDSPPPEAAPKIFANREIVRLWSDERRSEQFNRFKDPAMELQAGDVAGASVWERAHTLWQALPEGSRIDLPSPRVFGRILGVFRSGALVKDRPIRMLELSGEEIGELIGYHQKTVYAALRWLDTAPLKYNGEVVLAQGLGILHRSRRVGWGYLRGVRRRLYRTSRLVLTYFGQTLLGLDEDSREERKRKKRQKERDREARARGERVPPRGTPQMRDRVAEANTETINVLEHHEEPELARAEDEAPQLPGGGRALWKTLGRKLGVIDPDTE